ncbi:MAG: DUF4198 domain-containing protein [Verrucomicrobiota bacterium]
MKKLRSALVLPLLFTFGVSSQAHFLELLPAKALYFNADGGEVGLDILFGHPYYGVVLKADAPTEVTVLDPDGNTTGLTVKDDGNSKYFTSFDVKGPGDYTVVAKGAPFYESEEGLFIKQTSKVVVNAGGIEGAWNKPVGLPIEIVPLSRPYGLWAGSSFSAMVFVDGKPAPHVKVEITLARGSEKLPELSELHDVATLYTDGVGMFTVSLPVAGWWGLSAISLPEETMKAPDGKEVPVELDGLIWIYADSLSN